jgi:Zn-dependent peptidase ImmA (M78 family)|uniref:IrrE protein n=1 Tax=Siphoviridae sp. ctKvA22 TaxID=2826246 RepID=A0A8S5MAR4_9CAUD|nr:MAG TPA: IrrE protein [Siphoviridae sp. ctKvA22]
MYNYYKEARNISWGTLLECGINQLPVNLGSIADYYGIKIILYSKTDLLRTFPPDAWSGDGFIVNRNKRKQIFINDKIKNRPRRRFTLAHELGHAIMNHNTDTIHYRNSEFDNESNPFELQANVFARDILMPATVLAALDIHTPEEIMALCDISYQSAKIRAERLELLYRRDKFNTHPLEKQVREQFDDFIRGYRK